MHPRVAILLCALGAFARPAAASEPLPGDPREWGLPVLDTFTPSPALVSGSVSALARSRDGTLFVGSNRLSEFDGSRWRQIEVPGARRILTLTPSSELGDRIWVGAVGAVGFVTRDPSGRWVFTSIAKDLAPAHLSESTGVWHIQVARGSQTFVTDSKIVRLSGTTCRVWDLHVSTRLHAFDVGGELYVYKVGVGLLRVGPEGPEARGRDAAFPAKGPLLADLSLPDAEFMVFPQDVFRSFGGAWRRVDGVSDALKNGRATCAVRLGDSEIAIGTAVQGVLLLKADGTLTGHIDSRAGLADDNVSAVWGDGAGNLWIGMDIGLARVSGNGGVTTRFDHRAGLGFMGIIRRVMECRGRRYVLTSRSLYGLEPSAGLEPAHLAIIRNELPTTLFSDGTLLDGRLWFTGADGLMELTGDRAVRETSVTSEVSLILAPSSFPGTLLFFQGADVRGWCPQAADFLPRDMGCVLSGPADSAVEGPNGDLLVATASGHVQVLAPDGSRLHLVRELMPGLGLTARSGPRLRLSRVGDRVLAFSDTDILALNPGETAFESVALFSRFSVVASAEDPSRSRAFWIVQCKDLGPDRPYATIAVTPGSGPDAFAWAPVDVPGLDHVGRVSSISATVGEPEPVLWIGGTDGLLRFAPHAMAATAPVSAVVLKTVEVDGSREVELSRGAPISFPPSVGTVELSYAAASASLGDLLLYQTRLDGTESDWSPPSLDGSREFIRLSPGSYSFSARAVDRFGRTGPELHFRFAMDLPWYRRFEAFGLYAALAFFAAFAVARFRLRATRRQAARLNQLVDERTRELSLSNTATSDFLENISHEIRDPIQGIIGLIHLLDERQPAGCPRDLTQSIRACARSLDRVFTDILGFSKLECGFVSVASRPFELRRALVETCEIFLGTARQQGNSLETRFPPDWTDGFRGDEAKIKAIVGNFLSNALKYAPGSAIVVAVSLLGGETGAAEVLIEVTDGGPGIPPEEQEIIFNKFVRGTGARGSKAAGTGLGLAASRSMAKLLGGCVGVESAMGCGATFFLQVPLERLRPASAGAIPPAFAPSALIVDDQLFNQVVLRGVAEDLGFEATCAGDAAEAIAAASRARFALILIDLELPGIKGPELARRLRARTQAPAVILGMSAHPSGRALGECRDAGMDGFIEKPVNRVRICAALGQLKAGGPGDSEPDLATLELHPDGLVQAIRGYLETLESETAELGRSVRGDDPERILAAVHRLHSHAALVGAAGLGALADRAEAELRSGNSRALVEALVPILGAVHRLRRDLVSQLSFAPAGPAPAFLER